jgi:hypothetical protein
MNVAELIAILEILPEVEKQKIVMVEVEREIYFNLQQVKYKNGKFVILSMFPDPFVDALKKAGIE